MSKYIFTFNTFEWVGPLVPYARMRNTAEGADIEKIWKLRETAFALTLDIGQCDILLRIPSTVMPGKGVIYWICNGMSCWNGWIASNHWVRGNCSVSIRIPLTCCWLELLKHIIPGMEYAPRKEGMFLGVLVWHIPLPVQLLMPDNAASPDQYVRYDNQVKFLKLPTSLSSWPGGHILFSTGTIIWPLSLFPPLAFIQSIRAL